jgi:hypothetical protein
MKAVVMIAIGLIVVCNVHRALKRGKYLVECDVLEKRISGIQGRL